MPWVLTKGSFLNKIVTAYLDYPHSLSVFLSPSPSPSTSPSLSLSTSPSLSVHLPLSFLFPAAPFFLSPFFSLSLDFFLSMIYPARYVFFSFSIIHFIYLSTILLSLSVSFLSSLFNFPLSFLLYS